MCTLYEDGLALVAPHICSVVVGFCTRCVVQSSVRCSFQCCYRSNVKRTGNVC